MQNTTYTYLVAGEPVSTYALVEDTTQPRTAIVCNLDVPEELRHRGFGSDAMRDAESKAKGYGSDRIRLEAGAMSWKRRWYARMGYQPLPVGTPVMWKHPFYIWMEKAI